LIQVAEILDRLVPELGALDGEPVPLQGGITNRNYVASLGGVRYVVRLPGKDTGLLEIDRAAERAANEAAARAGVGPEVAAMLEDPPCLVTRFLEGTEMSAAQLREPAALAEVAALLAALHGGGERVGSAFSGFRIVETYADTARARGGELPPGYDRAHASAQRIEAAFEAAEGAGALGAAGHSPVLCHDDLLAANFLRSGEGIRIVDWEYAGMGDRWFDLGNFAVNNELGEADEAAFLAAYLGAPAGPAEQATLRLMRFMSDFREAMWGVVQGSIADLEFDFGAYAAKHFERLAAAEADPRFEAWIGDARGTD
jgi:thiamine kinase-like enzyme